MARAGWILLSIGILIGAVGTIQLPLVVALSGDPTLNPVGNGILMWLSWGVAGVLVVVGASLALIGRAGGKPSRPA
jgi:hypothetical protein